MNSPARRLWGLAAVAGATAVGVTTRDAGFVVITLLGGLALPRILGLGGHRHGPGGPRFGCRGRHGARTHLEERLATWHRQAHGEAGAEPAGPAPSAGAV